jgi:hypothetical protein
MRARLSVYWADPAHHAGLSAKRRADWADPAWRARQAAGSDPVYRARRAGRPVALQDWLDRYVDPEPTSGCWIWIGPRAAYGYGTTYRVPSGGRSYAHRVLYEAAGRRLVPGYHLHHLCGLRCCVNPDHLVPLSPAEHTRITFRHLMSVSHSLALAGDGDDTDDRDVTATVTAESFTCLCGRTPGVFVCDACEGSERYPLTPTPTVKYS